MKILPHNQANTLQIFKMLPLLNKTSQITNRKRLDIILKSTRMSLLVWLSTDSPAFMVLGMLKHIKE
jgi:hypothetical protein